MQLEQGQQVHAAAADLFGDEKTVGAAAIAYVASNCTDCGLSSGANSSIASTIRWCCSALVGTLRGFRSR
ncbi:hypothetical protein [Kibdelosporangium aridum]|uniref:hypothetical protein n=1 Tax=Kibdelosporangium aridum TaxID=2030 RepID=UPI000A485EF9|nr:hypothetical protein [Kibdelosporangium aridum]